jgi:drug/metabolite transporter (DMT)-like permease
MALVLIFYPGTLTISVTDLFLCALYGAVLSTCVNVTFILASKFLFAAELTLFMLLEFALSPIWVWLFVGETPTFFTIIGGLVVVLAVGVRSLSEMDIYSKNRRKIPQNPL